MNAIAEKSNFQERMKDRIKNLIGELMTDSELSEIVHRAMEEIFFKPMEIKDGYQIKEVPPFVHQLLKELLTKSVRDEVAKYITDNKDLVQKNIQQVITQGMGKALVEAITFHFSNDLINFQTNLMATLGNR